MYKQLIHFNRNRYIGRIIPATSCLLLCSILIFGFRSGNLPAVRLKIATCQFPVSGDVHKNAQFIKDFIKEAALQKADIVHFSEASLTGYPPMDIPSFDNYDWDGLSKETKDIMAVAKQFNVWVVLGSAHYIDHDVKPTNCLYIISNKGEIVDRYDKSMLTDGDNSDVNFYSPGNHITIININGFKCGFLICYDSCFPEMYNIYRHKGVKIVFHSFYNAHHQGRTILDDIIPAEIRVRASDNLMWVIANNSSGDYSSWPACIARPDGSMETLQRGIPGILYREFPDKEIVDGFPSWTHNNKIMKLPVKEVYHNGIPSNRPRAIDTKSLPYEHPDTGFLQVSNYQFPAAGTLSKTPITAVPTFQNISLYWKPTDGASTREALVRYRIKGTFNWSQAQSLWFDDRTPDSIGNNTARSKEYRGSLVNLRSGTVYEIEVFLTGVKKIARTTASTWNEKFPVGKTIVFPATSNKTFVITEGGSASGYVLYTAPAGKSATIDVKNLKDYNIDVRAPYVIISNLVLKGAKIHGVRIAPNMTDIVIENNDISCWGRMEVDGWGKDRDAAVSTDNVDNTGLRRIIIQYNKMHHPRYNTNNWKQYRTAFGSYHPGGPQSVSFNYTLGQLVIRGNEIYSDSSHYFNDGIGGGENFSFISGFPGPDSDIYDNRISYCWDDAIESEGMNQNVRVFNNFIDLSYVAHGVSATSIGPLYVYRNITNRLQLSPENSYNSGYWFKSQGMIAYGGRVYVYHNTMLTIQNEGGISDVGKVLSNTISRNNILRSANNAVIDRSGDPQTSCDYDLIDGSITTINQNHERHAIFAVPQFDMKAPVQSRGLLPHSPGQDIGAIRLPNFNDKFKGKAPDMGAVER